MITRSTILLAGLIPLAACGTATYVTIDSQPEGARIYVQGVDTGRTTPTTIDLEAYARDPDEPMPVMIEREGFVPTWMYPYPRRHQCGLPVCEKKVRHCLDQDVPLFRDGHGVHVETDRENLEVAIDDAAWTRPHGEARSRFGKHGATFAVSPGKHTFWYRWRTADGKTISRYPPNPSGVDIVVPERGYLFLHVHRWPWGIPWDNKSVRPPK